MIAELIKRLVVYVIYPAILSPRREEIEKFSCRQNFVFPSSYQCFDCVCFAVTGVVCP